MANKTFTYKVNVDTSGIAGKQGEIRRALEGAFSPISASPFSAIAKEIEQVRKNLTSLSKIDLSTSFDQFSAQLKQVQAEARAVDSLLKGLASSGNAIQLGSSIAQVEQLHRQLEAISRIDVSKPFNDIRTQLAQIQASPIAIPITINSVAVAAEAAKIQEVLKTAFAGVENASLPANSIVAGLQLIKSNLDMIGKTDISRIFIDLNTQINQAITSISAIEQSIQQAFTLRNNSLVQSVEPQINAIKAQLESINQVDVTQSIDDIKTQLGELKQVMAGISLSSRFRTPPKFEERIATLKRNLEGISTISIEIPNPFTKLKDWTIEARQEIAALKQDINSVQPKGKKKGEDVTGASALKAELQTINQIDISAPVAKFREQVALAIADLAKLKADTSTNAVSQSQAGSGIGKTFTGFTDLSNPIMQRQSTGLKADMAQVQQQISAISNMDVSAPLDDLHRTALTVQTDIAKLQNDLSRIQQPKASMSLSDLTGGGGDDSKPKRGRTKKITDEAANAAADATALQTQINEVKAKLEELNTVVASLNTVNINDNSAVKERLAGAKKNLDKIVELLNGLANYSLSVDLSALLGQVKKVSADLTKIGQFSELAKINPTGDTAQVQQKVEQLRQSLINVDNSLKNLSGLTLNTDLTELMNNVRTMRRNIAYLSAFSDNLSNIGTTADFTPLNRKVEQLRQSLIHVNGIVNGLSAAIPQGDLSGVIAKISKVKDDLGAIGRAAAELVNIQIEGNPSTASANIAKLDALKNPLANLAKTLGELDKIKLSKDVTNLAAQLGIIQPSVSMLASAINGLASISITSDPTTLANSLESAKAQLGVIRQALSDLSGFKIDANIGTLGAEIEKARLPLVEIANAITGFQSITIPTDTAAISNLTSQLRTIKKPLADLGTALTGMNGITVQGELTPLATQLTSAKAELAELDRAIADLLTVTRPQDPTAISGIATQFTQVKKPISDLGKILPELSLLIVGGDLASISMQLVQARVELTNLSNALVDVASATVPPDAASLLTLIEKFNQAKKPIAELGKMVSTLSTATVNGNLSGLASQLTAIKGPLSEIGSALGEINSIVPPGQASVITQLVGALSGAGKGSVGASQVSSQVGAVVNEAQRVKDALAQIPQMDLTRPTEALLDDLDLIEKEIKRLDAAIQDTFIKGGGGLGGNNRSNALLDDYYKKLAQSLGDEAANIARAKGVVPNMGAINSEFASDKTPVDEFEVNAKRNSVEEKRRQSIQEQMANLANEEQIIAKQISRTQIERALNDREIAATQQEMAALTEAQAASGQREYLANLLVSYQDESERLTKQEAQQIADLTRKKQEIAALSKKTTAKELPKEAQPTEAGTPARVTVSITDKNAENAQKLVESLVKAASAMEAVVNWSDRELANQRTSLEIEREKSRMKREEARLTEAEVQQARTDAEQARINLQLQSGINQAETERKNLVSARVQFEKEVTAEVRKQVELYQSIKFTNRAGAQTVQATQQAQAGQTQPTDTNVPESIYAASNEFVTAVKAMTTGSTNALATSAATITSTLATTQQQIAQAVQNSPVPTALNQLTTSMQQQVANQATAISQYQSVAQSLQQVLERKQKMDEASSGQLLAGRLQSQIDFGGVRFIQGSELNEQIDALKGKYQDLTNLTRGAKETVRAELNQMTTDAQVSYNKRLSDLNQYNSNLRNAYQEDANAIKRQIEARRELLSQQSAPADKLRTTSEIDDYQSRLNSLTNMFDKEQEIVRRQKEALKAEYDDLNNEVKLKLSALSAPAASDPNALSNAKSNQVQIEQRQQQELAQIRKQEIDSLRQSTEAQKAELEKRANQIRSSVGAESNLSRRALEEKRNAVQQELNILQQANQQRMGILQQEASAMRRSRADQISPLKKQISELKQAAEAQTGVEREATEKTIAELQRRVEATRSLYSQQINAVNQSISGLRQAYQQQIAPLQEQMTTLSNAQPSTSIFEKFLTVGKSFASAYATIMGSRQIIQSAVAMAQYDTQVRRARVATIELAGSSQKASSAVGAIRGAAGGTVDRLTAMQIANQAMALGLASTSEDFEKLTIAARGVALVSPVIHDVQSAITELALASANMSFRRLDQLGLSVTEVKGRIDELKKSHAELSDNQRFYMASVDILNEKFGKLVNSAEAGATGIEKLTVAWNDLSTGDGIIGRIVNKLAEIASLELDKLDITFGNTQDTQKQVTVLDDYIERAEKALKVDQEYLDSFGPKAGPLEWGSVTQALSGRGAAERETEQSQELLIRLQEARELLIQAQELAKDAGDEGVGVMENINAIATDINTGAGPTTQNMEELRKNLDLLKNYRDTALEESLFQRNADALAEMTARAKEFGVEIGSVGDAIARFRDNGMGEFAEELRKIQTKKLEKGSLSDEDEQRLNDLISASKRVEEVAAFAAEATQLLGAEFANTDKEAVALKDSVLALNAGLASGAISKMEFEEGLKRYREQLTSLANFRADQFSNLIREIDAGLTTLLNRDGKSKAIEDQIEQLRRYKLELLTTGVLDEKDAGAARNLAGVAQSGGFQSSSEITPQSELAAANESYANLISLQQQLNTLRNDGILTEQMYAEAVASVNREMQNIEINAVSDTINSANELSTAILNLDAASAGGLPGLAEAANQAMNLSIAMNDAGFATQEQIQQAEYYAALSGQLASSTGTYAQAVGALGEQFFATNPAMASMLQHIIELEAAHASGGISSEVFAGKLSILMAEMIALGQQAGLTAAQIQAAFSGIAATTATLKVQFGGTAGFMRGAQLGSGLVAADRRNENERVRQEQIKSAKSAGQAIERAAKASEKIWEDAAKQFEDTLKKIPGLFKTTDVTEQDMKSAKAGTYVDKVDEYVRRLRDEVFNKKDWAGVSIADARAGLARAGLDSGGNDEQVFAKFEEAWNNQSLWASAENIPLFMNEEAVKFQKGLQDKIKLGTENLLAYFGEVVETETGKKYTIEPGSKEDWEKKAKEAADEAMKSGSGGGGGGASAGAIEAVKATFADTTWMDGAIKTSLAEATAALGRIGVEVAGKSEEEILKMFDQAVADGSLFSVDTNANLLNPEIVKKQQERQAQAQAGQQKLTNLLNGAAATTIDTWNAGLDSWFQSRAVTGPIQGPANIKGATNVKTNGSVTTGEVELDAKFKVPEEPIEVDAKIKGLTIPDEAIAALKEKIGTLIIPVSILANTGETLAESIGTELQSVRERFIGQGGEIGRLIGEGISSYKFIKTDSSGKEVGNLADDLIGTINKQFSAKANMFYASGILVAQNIYGGISGYDYTKTTDDGTVTNLADELIAKLTDQYSKKTDTIKSHGGTIAYTTALGFIEYDYAKNKLDMADVFVKALGAQFQAQTDMIRGQGGAVAQFMAEGFNSYLSTTKQGEDKNQQQNPGIADGQFGLFSSSFIESEMKKLTDEMIENLRTQFSAQSNTDILMGMGNGAASFIGFGFDDYAFGGVADGLISDLESAFQSEEITGRLMGIGAIIGEGIKRGLRESLNDESLSADIASNLETKTLERVTNTLTQAL